MDSSAAGGEGADTHGVPQRHRTPSQRERKEIREKEQAVRVEEQARMRQQSQHITWGARSVEAFDRIDIIGSGTYGYAGLIAYFTTRLDNSGLRPAEREGPASLAY
jgi:glucosamine 6-phosphate synthetase-like amidotransferase/phosphosugar isomerase protein